METKFDRKQYTYLYLTFVLKVITAQKHIILYLCRKLSRIICKPLFRLVIKNFVNNFHTRYIFIPLLLSKNINIGNQTHSKYFKVIFIKVEVVELIDEILSV